MRHIVKKMADCPEGTKRVAGYTIPSKCRKNRAKKAPKPRAPSAPKPPRAPAKRKRSGGKFTKSKRSRPHLTKFQRDIKRKTKKMDGGRYKWIKDDTKIGFHIKERAKRPDGSWATSKNSHLGKAKRKRSKK
jgi:hypothetical protein